MTSVHLVQRRLTPLAILLLTLPVTAAGQQVRILQSSQAGDRIHIIDPATNKVVGEIPGIEAAHGVTSSLDGTRIFVSNEAENTLDVADYKTLKVIKKIPLSGEPNNIAISPDGRRVYVGIREAVGNNPGVADVVDTASLTKIKSIRTDGPIHNLYVTQDGKHVYAGDAVNGYVSVLDTQTDAPAWSVQFAGHIGPMASDKNPDGSTRNLYIQWADNNGFSVVDFKTRKIVNKMIELPKLAPGKIPLPTGSGPSHGLAVTPDQKALMVCSRLNNALYSYSLPDLKLLGTAYLTGGGCAWVTLTPDGKRAYIADPVKNDTLVVDIPTMKEVAKIRVGHVPKRNHTMVIPAGKAATQN